MRFSDDNPLLIFHFHRLSALSNAMQIPCELWIYFCEFVTIWRQFAKPVLPWIWVPDGVCFCFWWNNRVKFRKRIGFFLVFGLDFGFCFPKFMQTVILANFTNYLLIFSVRVVQWLDRKKLIKDKDVRFLTICIKKIKPTWTPEWGVCIYSNLSLKNSDNLTYRCMYSIN